MFFTFFECWYFVDYRPSKSARILHFSPARYTGTSLFTEEKETIEKGLEACSGAMSISNLPVFLENAISLSRKLNTVWTSGDIQLKEDLQKLIFPEGVYYNRKTQSFRTEKVNFILELIAAGTPPEKKKGTSYLIDYLSLSAEREGSEPALLRIVSQLVEYCKMGDAADDAGETLYL